MAIIVATRSAQPPFAVPSPSAKPPRADRWSVDRSSVAPQFVDPQSVDPPLETPLARATQAFAASDTIAAQRHIRQAMIQQGDDPDVLQLAARIHARAGEAEQATELYRRAVATLPQTPLPLFDEWGRWEMQRGRPFEAIAILRQAVELHPEHPPLRRDIAGLLASLGEQEEAGTHLRWLAQRGHAGPSELTMLADMTRPQTDEKLCQFALERFPQDQRPWVAEAKRDAYFGRWQMVRDKTRRARASHPGDAACEALHARALAELGEFTDQTLWHTWIAENKDLLADIEKQPDYWLALGVRARNQQQLPRAAYCFARAASLTDDHVEALGQLAGCLSELQTDEEYRRRLTQRLSRLTSVRQLVDRLASEGYRSQDAMIRIAKELDSLGRLWEAAAWLRVAATLPTQSAELVSLYESIRQRLGARTPWLLASHRIVDASQLSDFAKRSENSIAHSETTSATSPPQPSTPAAIPSANPETTSSNTRAFGFVDEAFQRGVKHVCKIGKPDGDESDLWIFQSIVGGAAVLDYDHDGWPDLYFTNANGTPYETDSDANALFRNEEGTFRNGTDSANVGDRGFAQGVAVGDYNSDGFPDLFVANIGTNRLLRNNGDGTFNDVTSEVGLGGARWTTSLAALDIDLDGHLDLYEVGYCNGSEPFEQKCSRDGFTRSCSPVSFRAETDRVWRGTGDGRFEDVSNRWLRDQQPSYGLALLAGFFDDAPGIDIYVGNDMAANHLWSTRPSDPFQLEEQASLRGIAVDARSQAQASMGMAVGDPDHDGDFDFFLTHHASESNTLYEQIRPGVWADHTTRLNLRDSSIAMLGFGTAWFDFDNDGHDELLVCNGHVDDFAHLGEPYRMPMQAYERQASGRWNLIPPDVLGEPFHEPRLARCLVTVDVNRDGHVDAAVTHLFDPVSLLVSHPTFANETPANKSVTFRLQGRTSQRDAIGGIVSLEINGERRTSQLIAGDGFQGSSERCVRFGVGTASRVDNVQVQWPGGEVESLGSLETNQNYLIIEGDKVPFSTPLRNAMQFRNATK